MHFFKIGLAAGTQKKIIVKSFWGTTELKGVEVEVSVPTKYAFS